MKQKRRPTTWRDYLTAEEAEEVVNADRLKAAWRQANRTRAGIVNRAVNRAKYAAKNSNTNGERQ